MTDGPAPCLYTTAELTLEPGPLGSQPGAKAARGHTWLVLPKIGRGRYLHPLPSAIGEKAGPGCRDVGTRVSPPGRRRLEGGGPVERRSACTPIAPRTTFG